jgi:hypothetical protein
MPVSNEKFQSMRDRKEKKKMKRKPKPSQTDFFGIKGLANYKFVPPKQSQLSIHPSQYGIFMAVYSSKEKNQICGHTTEFCSMTIHFPPQNFWHRYFWQRNKQQCQNTNCTCLIWFCMAFMFLTLEILKFFLII